MKVLKVLLETLCFVDGLKWYVIVVSFETLTFRRLSAQAIAIPTGLDRPFDEEIVSWRI